MSDQEHDNVVTVTGGATGVGAAVVDQLLDRGATVHVLDVADVAARQGVHAVHCDLAEPASIDEAITQLPDRIDAHINVAGVAGRPNQRLEINTECTDHALRRPSRPTS